MAESLRAVDARDSIHLETIGEDLIITPAQAVDSASSSAIPSDPIPTTNGIESPAISTRHDPLTNVQQIGTSQNEDVQVPGDVMITVDESGIDGWTIAGTINDEETDRFGKYLKPLDKELHKVYQDFRKEGRGILRSAFAAFTITESQDSGCSVAVNAIMPQPIIDPVTKKTWGERFRSLLNGRHDISQPEDSLSYAICKLTLWLQRPARPGLQLVLVARKTKKAADVFSYWRIVTDDTAASRRSTRELLPSRILLHSLKFSNFCSTWVINTKPSDYRYIPRRLNIRLPSQPRSSSETSFLYTWPRSIPTASRSAIYIWQSYKRPAEFEDVELRIERLANGVVKAILIFETDAALNDVARILHKSFKNNESPIAAADIGQAQIDVLKYVLVCQIVSKVQDFLKSTLYTLYEQDLEARDDPDRTRFLYLTQLKDYILRMQEEIELSLGDLQLESWKESTVLSEKMIKDLEGDCLYLQDKIKTSLSEIAELGDQLGKLSSFRQTQHGFFLNLLLGTFVPLGFVTGVFGMNIMEINGSPIPLTFVLEIAVPLTILVIAIPLTFGPLIRALFRCGRLIKHHAMASLPSLGSLMVVASIVTVPWHIIEAFSEVHGNYIEVHSFGDFLWDLKEPIWCVIRVFPLMFIQLSSLEVPIIYSFLTIGAMIILTPVFAARKTLRNPDVMYWMVVATAAGICAGFNHLDQTQWVTYTVPLVILFSPFIAVIMLDAVKKLWVKVSATGNRAPVVESAL